MRKNYPAEEADNEARGYGNPPLESRFRQGQSGNPAGRPKGSKNRRPALAERFRSIMLEEAYRPIRLSKAGQEFTLPMAQVVLRKMAHAAAKGEARAQAMFLKMVSASVDDEEAIAAMTEEAREKAREQEIDEEPIEVQFRIVDEKGHPTGDVYRYNNDGELEKVEEQTPSTG